LVPSRLHAVAGQLKLFDPTSLAHNGAGQTWALEGFAADVSLWKFDQNVFAVN